MSNELFVEEGYNGAKYYDKDAVDALLTKKDKEIKELKDKIKIYEDLGSCKKGCPALRHNQRRVESEIYKVELKDKEIRRLRRALYKACANWARSERYTEATWHGDEHREELWAEVQDKCRAKAEVYK